MADNGKNGYFSITEITPTLIGGSDHILANSRYNFIHFHRWAGADSGEVLSPEGVRTTLVLTEGLVYVQLGVFSKTIDGILGPGDGLYIPEGATSRIRTLRQTTGYAVSSPSTFLAKHQGNFKWTPPEYLFSLGENGKFPSVYSVNKPWGGEDWLTVLPDGHVLKRIWMHAGKRSSLQRHRFKEETNIIIQGSAEVILEDHEGMQQSKTVAVGGGWHVAPKKIHRVFAHEPYVAFEASTPEVDDVERLEDDSGRTSGRIDSEHQQG
jgi:mannose-6-phosphate isomerase-like protein (cupin superfamily)